jgi:hypothetical protein
MHEALGTRTRQSPWSPASLARRQDFNGSGLRFEPSSRVVGAVWRCSPHLRPAPVRTVIALLENQLTWCRFTRIHYNGIRNGMQSDEIFMFIAMVVSPKFNL